MKKKKSILKMVACILVLSLSLTMLQPLAVFAEQNISDVETTQEKWVPREEDIRLPNTTGDLTLEQLETAKLSSEDIPEYISQQDMEEKGHVNRLREQEPNDNTVIFQNRDGTKTAYFFSNPVKYTDKNGNTKDKYTKLDSTSIPERYSEKYGYVNQQNDIKTYFPKQMETNQGMLLESEEISIELIPFEATEKKYVLQNGSIVTPGEYISKHPTVSTKPLNNISTSNGITKIQTEKLTAQKANANKGYITDELTSIVKDTVQYNGVFGSKTTLRYSSTFEGLKEDIVLSENTGVNNFSFKLKTNGLSLVCGEDKQYYLADPLSGEYLVAIGKLIVYDSNNRIYKNDEGEEYNHHYEVTTVKADEEYILTIVVDEEFLNSSDTVYPVYIDPTMTVMPKGSVQDAAIYSSVYAFSNDEKIVKIGRSESYGIGRGLYNFPILNFNTDFIFMYGNQISSAKLNLYALPYGNSSSYDSSKTLSMYEFYSPWSQSTVKWNNTSPNNYGTYISSANVTSGWTTFDISYIVDKFKTDSDYTTDFKGVIIKANSESTSTWKKFVSSLNTTYSSTYRPYIEITYNDSPAACSQVVSGATYYLRNYNSEYLAVDNANTTDNTRLLTGAFNGNTNQQFKITNVSGGEYEIAPQHTTGKVLSVNLSGQVVIEEDCNLDRQRWYIYYRNGSYHIVNKSSRNGVMAPTYNTDYVSINDEYEHCCWELDRLTILDGFSNTEQELEEILQDINGLLTSYLQEISPPRYCNSVEITASNKSSYNCQGENIYNFLYDWYTEHIWPYEKQLPSWSYSAQQNEEATKRAALDEWSEAVYGETTWESIINSFDNYVNVLYYEIVDIQETLGSAFIQVVGGNYANEVTITGTTGQIILSFFGIDIVADVRDITYDITHWEWTWSHAGQTAVDLVALAPVIGALKNIDDLSVLFKRIDAISDIAKNADELQLLTSKIDEMILLAKQTDRFEEVANDTELWVKVASRNNDSNVVMLGKYFENADGTEAVDSYRKIAEAKGYAHYSMSTTTYNELKKVRTDGMFSINEQYLEIKISEGKTFYFSVDPNNPKYQTGDFNNELNYLRQKGYSFSTSTNSAGFYYAIKN